MRLFKKIKIFLFMSNHNKCLFIETLILLAYARILKLFPFNKVAPSLGKYMTESTLVESKSDNQTLKSVCDSIHIMSRYTFWESQCLVKAIAGMKMLERRKIDSTLYLGTGKDENGNLIAHAWLRSGPYIITGAEGIERFTIVGKFAKIKTIEKE